MLYTHRWDTMGKRMMKRYSLCAMVVCIALQLLAVDARPATITIRPDDILKSDFGGFGFQMDYYYWTKRNRVRGVDETNFANVISRRWKELMPGFARVGLLVKDWEPTQGIKTWDSDGMIALIKTLTLLKETNTEVYLTTWQNGDNIPEWLGSGHTLTDPAMQQEFARTHVDLLEYLVRTKGFTNISCYCMANELQTADGWGVLESQMDVFKAYHQKLFDELQRRGLAGQIKLLATDQSSSSGYSTIDWALSNMDAITGIYGGHHFTSSAPDTIDFYPESILPQLKTYSGLAAGKGKNFIIGEFGSNYNGGTWTCPARNYAGYGLMLAEFALAGLNSGTYAMSNWCFFDFYYCEGCLMQWGAFSDVESGFKIFPHYYAYGLMTRYFRPRSTVVRSTSDSSLLRVAVVRRTESGQYTLAIVNRKTADESVTIEGLPGRKTFDVYVYAASNPLAADGALPAAIRKVRMANQILSDTVPANSLTVYNEADEKAPDDSDQDGGH